MKRKPIIEIGENYKVHIQFFSVFTDVLLDRQASACYLKLAVQHHLRLNFEVKHVPQRGSLLPGFDQCILYRIFHIWIITHIGPCNAV